MKAYEYITNSLTGESVVVLNEHRFQFGGQGDGFCYEHSEFSCLDNLTVEEQHAIQNAEYVSEAQV